ncbi:MAG: peptidylprolyl isomerase [Gemmatimonadaceae bacterium]
MTMSRQEPRRARRVAWVVVLGVATLLAACGEKSRPAAVPTGPAPDSFRVAFTTSKGSFVVQANRGWAPNGVDRFYALATTGFFDDNRFFRVLPGYIAQFGINNEKKVNEEWDKRPLPDDPRTQSNARGTLVFTTSGPNTRSHQLFINLKDNPKLDTQGFVPFGRVVSGMEVVDSLDDEYGDTPKQQLISTLGNNYLLRMFPHLDYIVTAKLVTDTTSRVARSR